MKRNTSLQNYLVVNGRTPTEYLALASTPDFFIWVADPLDAQIFPTWRKAYNAAHTTNGLVTCARFHLQAKEA